MTIRMRLVWILVVSLVFLVMSPPTVFLHENAHKIGTILVGVDADIEYGFLMLSGVTVYDTRAPYPLLGLLGPTLFVYIPAFILMLVAWRTNRNFILIPISYIALTGGAYALTDIFVLKSADFTKIIDRTFIPEIAIVATAIPVSIFAALLFLKGCDEIVLRIFRNKLSR